MQRRAFTELSGDDLSSASTCKPHNAPTYYGPTFVQYTLKQHFQQKKNKNIWTWTLYTIIFNLTITCGYALYNSQNEESTTRKTPNSWCGWWWCASVQPTQHLLDDARPGAAPARHDHPGLRTSLCVLSVYIPGNSRIMMFAYVSDIAVALVICVTPSPPKTIAL